MALGIRGGHGGLRQVRAEARGPRVQGDRRAARRTVYGDKGRIQDWRAGGAPHRHRIQCGVQPGHLHAQRLHLGTLFWRGAAPAPAEGRPAVLLGHERAGTGKAPQGTRLPEIPRRPERYPGKVLRRLLELLLRRPVPGLGDGIGPRGKGHRGRCGQAAQAGSAFAP